jgi:hypothetical protein
VWSIDDHWLVAACDVDDFNEELHGTPGALRMAMLTAPRLQLLFDQAFVAVSRSPDLLT